MTNFTLQGLQAVYLLAGGFAGTVTLPGMAVDTVSLPLAFLGLTRLYAAAWITSDYEFVARAAGDVGSGSKPMLDTEAGGKNMNVHGRMVPLDPDVDGAALDVLAGMDARTKNRHCFVAEVNKTPVIVRVSSSGGGGGGGGEEALSPSPRFLSSSRPSKVFRGIYIAPLALFWVLSLGLALPGPWQAGKTYPLTSYLCAVNGSISFLFILVGYICITRCDSAADPP